MTSLLSVSQQTASPTGANAAAWRGLRVEWPALCIIIFGFLFRLSQYLANRSLWLDEAFIATAIIDSSFTDLLRQPLEYSHFAPPGFLVLVRACILIFGDGDLALRLVPFICGSVSLILFWHVARQFVSAETSLLAVCFFSVADGLIYYSSELKQYSTDVTVVIVLLLLARRALAGTPTKGSLSLLGGAGALAVWFSHPAVFVLTIIASVLLWSSLRERDWPRLMRYLAVTAIWTISFLSMYLLVIGHVGSSSPIAPWLFHFWKVVEDAFMPLSFTEGPKWVGQIFGRMFRQPAAFQLHGLASALFIAGCLAMGYDRRPLLALLAGPILLTLVASSFQLYPFAGRMLLFLTPALYILIAEGIVQITLALYPPASRMRTALSVALFILLIAGPAGGALTKMGQPRLVQEIKPVLHHIKERRLASDAVYIYFWAEPAFRYYAPRYGFYEGECRVVSPLPPLDFVKEVDYARMRRSLSPDGTVATRCIYGASEFLARSGSDMEHLRGMGRVWVVFSHVFDEERRRFLDRLDAMGKRVDERLEPGASAHLYLLD